MRDFLPRLVGNKELKNRIGADIAALSFSHAYIIEGEAGCGKRTMAESIAMALACEHRESPVHALPCGECAACRKIAAGLSPDVIRIARPAGRTSMGVETVRGLRDDVPVVPNDLSLKVYIVEDADTMTVQAQNALLLTLEEPPPFVVFLLLATRADALLETIRSRAPVLRMQPLSDEAVKGFLLSEQCTAKKEAAALWRDDGEGFAALLRMASGRIGRAIELLEDKKRAPLLAHRTAATELCHLLSHGKGVEILSHLLTFGSGREEVSARLTAVQLALRDLVLLNKAESAPLLFFTDREAAAELAATFTVGKLFSFVSATDAALDALSANANVRLTLCHMSSELIKG